MWCHMWDSLAGNLTKQKNQSERKKEIKNTTYGRNGIFLIPLFQQELQETERFSRKAAQAVRDLTRAEAEIELLQNLLRDKEEQVSAGSLRLPSYWSLSSS